MLHGITCIDMKTIKIRIITDFEWAHMCITKLELLHMKKTTQKVYLLLTYYINHVSIVSEVVHFGISIEICVAIEVLIWSQKTTPYIAPSSEVSVGLFLPKIKKQCTI
jgi:hypothetical protein